MFKLVVYALHNVFMRSVDSEPNVKHVLKGIIPISKLFVEESDAYQLAEYLLPSVKAIWKDYLSPEGKFCLSHDVYLKIYAISKPTIPVDYLLFDEAQDADPLMLDILSNQKCKVIYVGDPHQQIYAWRGAVNAMQSIDSNKSYLTKSFRFGENIAFIANILLKSLGESNSLKGVGAEGLVGGVDYRKIDAVLCRTNSGAVDACLEISLKTNRRISLDLSDLSSLKSLIKDIHEFRLDPSSKSDHYILCEFEDYVDFEQYCKSSDADEDVSRPYKLYEKYGYDQIMRVFSKFSKRKNADITVSTVHKSKGLEWDNVLLWEDFEGISYKEIKQEKPSNDDDSIVVQTSKSELRLLYVAVTRAKKFLDVSSINLLLDALKSNKVMITGD